MAGRRSYPRFVVTNSAGVMKIARDVTVTSAGNELLAVSSEAAGVGDAVTIELVTEGRLERLELRVAASHPVVVAGILRYRIHMPHPKAVGRAADDEADRQQTPWKTNGHLRLVRGKSRPD
jgi:hypothetical protein